MTTEFDVLIRYITKFSLAYKALSLQNVYVIQWKCIVFLALFLDKIIVY